MGKVCEEILYWIVCVLMVYVSIYKDLLNDFYNWNIIFF